jgi:uncharacterized protein DUF6458
MGISVGLLLFAVGAILRYAVSTNVDGINLEVVGVILMIVGVVGALASAVFWSSFSRAEHEPAGDREAQQVPQGVGVRHDQQLACLRQGLRAEPIPCRRRLPVPRPAPPWWRLVTRWSSAPEGS